MLSDWLDDLRLSLQQEFGDKPPVMMLASVDRAGVPHVRSVVCRWIDGEGRLIVAIDARSSKVPQFQGNPRAETLFWLEKSKAQFRIAGSVGFVSVGFDEPLRLGVWRNLSDRTRATYFWPIPGIAASSDDAFAQAVAIDVSPPRNFELLVLSPTQVDRLRLDTHPHHRRVWRIDTQWTGVDVNP